MTTNLVRSSKYDDNIERLGEHSDTCFICGKRAPGTDLFVHYLTSGKLTDMPEHKDSQGFFPVGPECAKKYKKFIHYLNRLTDEA